MSLGFLLVRILAVGIVLIGSVVECWGQSAANPNTVQGEVVLAKLAQPVYPPLARQTGITGDVELLLEIKNDGSVQSSTVVSGHPLLQQAALDSAKRSTFECRNCEQAVQSFRIYYSFQLGPTVYCSEGSVAPKDAQREESYPRVTQSQNRVTVFDRPVGTCDMAGSVTKTRSWKCLYLWRCALH
jgi:TonB family protein